MNKISGIVIAKNAESLIADCLDSLSFCDEIIVIDNKSDDRTGDIAEKMGANVYKYISNDFSKLRNFGLKKAKYKWVLYVDTDEKVTEELKRCIKSEINNNANGYSAYRIKRKNFYFGNHEWPHVERLERLFQREKLDGWYGELHESPKVKGLIGELNGYLYHFTRRDLSVMLKKTIEWSTVEAELRYLNNHPKMKWWRFPRVMLTTFFSYYIKQEGWKAGTVGLIESLYQAFSIFITYAKLWEMQQEKK
ncbi:MAG: glycosyltransferase family 2 protein [Candidatus Levybacteria bacterium]|nr:glycosyltransferase family 2 protein [Candidatus Levybacteria bacterium]